MQTTASLRVNALFGKKSNTAVVEKPTPAPSKKSLLSWPSKPAQKKESAKVVDKAADYKKKQSFVSAIDFAEVRSKSDAELLWEAKYGDRGADGKMSREQYRALRRKIGGTAKDFWKTSIDVKGQYVEKGYVSRSGSVSNSAGALPVLAGGAGLFLVGTLALLVQSTS